VPRPVVLRHEGHGGVPAHPPAGDGEGPGDGPGAVHRPEWRAA
jgi:hypothetical protein